MQENRPADISADAEVMRGVDGAERLVKLQKNAARLQHALNNPLAALLAEGQLLSMEDTLSAEQRDAVERMITLTRRVIGLVRELDELRGMHPPR
jgi:light-regulated signal transduction histidine kinase (bacteriophytochrome)